MSVMLYCVECSVEIPNQTGTDWADRRDAFHAQHWHPSPSCQRRYSPPQRLSPSGHQSQGLALEALAGWVRERLRHYVMAGEQVKPSTLRKGRVTMGKVKRKARARVEFVTRFGRAHV